MEIKSLENTPLSEIVACFNLAFSDYFVPISATEAYLQNRWRGNRVDYSISFGAFENGKLIGFIITGVDNLNGIKTAYNSGTGVIPEYRGQKLVSKLYAHALPYFKNASIGQCTLEVIKQNEKAIKAYQNVGFEITRTLHCFKGNIEVKKDLTFPEKNYSLLKTRAIDFESLKALQPFEYSWENQNEYLEILKNEFEAWKLFQDDQLKGFIILNPVSGSMAQLGFEKSIAQQAANILFNAIAEKTSALKINNVDSQAKDIVELLKNTGLENHIDQYEMVMLLK